MSDGSYEVLPPSGPNPASASQQTLHTATSARAGSGTGDLPPQEIAAACDVVVGDFRNGTISKDLALLRVTALIPVGTNDEQRSAALGAYRRQLEEHERGLAAAHKRGRRADGGDPLEQDNPGSGEGEGDLDGAGSDAEGDRPTKKSKSSEFEDELSRMPWVTEQDSIANQLRLSPSLLATKSILVTFAKDHKKVKAVLLTSPGRPSLPSSEWDNLIHGRVIDLDKVLTSQYSALPDDGRTQRIGPFEVVVPGDSVPATRKVKSQGDWITAWSVASKATKFLFRHRSTELDQWGSFITSLFSAWVPESHSRIIEFDRQIRGTVANRGDLELTDFSNFDFIRIREQFLSVTGKGTGAASTTSSSSPRPPPGGEGKSRKNEACRRFNSGVEHDASHCRYTHKCSACGAGHKLSECKGKGKAT